MAESYTALGKIGSCLGNSAKCVCGAIPDIRNRLDMGVELLCKSAAAFREGMMKQQSVM
jgi:hypothetical protein